MKFAKLIASVIGAGLAAAVAAFTDNDITNVEKINIAIAVVTAASVFTAPNVPGAMYTKSILAVLGAVLVFLTSAITDGVNTAEWLQVGVIALTALGVYAVPNSTDEIRSSSLRCLAFFLSASLLLSTTACFGGGEKSPTREDFLRYSRETVNALRDVVPVLRANQISVAALESGIGIGDRLVRAFESNQNAAALLLTAELITVFEASQAEFESLNDGLVKTAILVAMAFANAALRRLADVVEETVVAIDARGVKVPGVSSFQNSAAKSKAERAKEKIKAFKKKKQWRCKNARTGRFEKMEFCKANPDISYVVTFAVK